MQLEWKLGDNMHPTRRVLACMTTCIDANAHPHCLSCQPTEQLHWVCESQISKCSLSNDMLHHLPAFPLTLPLPIHFELECDCEQSVYSSVICESSVYSSVNCEQSVYSGVNCGQNVCTSCLLFHNIHITRSLWCSDIWWFLWFFIPKFFSLKWLV
jgi:hypothetical protein